MILDLPSRQLTYPLPIKAFLNGWVSFFPRWDMLVPYRVDGSGYLLSKHWRFHKVSLFYLCMLQTGVKSTPTKSNMIFLLTRPCCFPQHCFWYAWVWDDILMFHLFVVLFRKMLVWIVQKVVMSKLKTIYMRYSEFMFTFAQDGHMPRYDVYTTRSPP